MTDLIPASMLITEEQKKFFSDTKICLSTFIRDLIINSKAYKDWEKDGG